jgi:phage terminase large subunit
VDLQAAIKKHGPYHVYQQLTADPVDFASAVLNINPWSKQATILRTIAAYDRVAVRSGHKVGKSTLAAIAALWFPHAYPGGRVIMTAPTARQVRNVLWREVRRLYRRSSLPLGGKMNLLPALGWQAPNEGEILGFTTNEPEKIAGVSGEYVLYIVDEGSGVEDDIFEAIEGSRAGGAKLLVLGNPTRTSGAFYRAFTSEVAGWKALHVSSEDSPNITGEVKVPGLATRLWVEEKLRDWGEGSPLFQVRVRGNFPTQAENSVIGIGLIEAARQRYEDVESTGLLRIGVDVARFGDDESVIWPVRDLKALDPTVLKSLDTVQVAGKVMECVKANRRGRELVRIQVDVIGVGAGVADILRNRHDEGIMVVDINAGGSSTDSNYARVRDEMWFQLKSWLQGGAGIPDDGMLHQELLAPTYAYLPTQRIKVESKDDLKKRLNGRSTDRADALALAIYTPIIEPPASFGVEKFTSPRPTLDWSTPTDDDD